MKTPVTIALAGLLTLARLAGAQQPAASTPAPDPDRRPSLAQPDYTLITMPTTLRLAAHKSAFRLTHRFGRPLGAGSFGNLAEDLFGLDSGAQIGLEYRYAPMRGTQLGFNRTSNRTIEFFGQYQVLRQDKGKPFTVDALVAVDGTNNFRDSYSPSVGAVISRTFGNHGALYVQPSWINNTNALPGALADHNSTTMLGIGGRLRIRKTVYLVAEANPRLNGYHPGTHQGAFGIEKRAGGHVFQLNFSNGFGTTPSQIARGGTGSKDWYIGFNLSRKF